MRYNLDATTFLVVFVSIPASTTWRSTSSFTGAVAAPSSVVLYPRRDWTVVFEIRDLDVLGVGWVTTGAISMTTPRSGAEKAHSQIGPASLTL